MQDGARQVEDGLERSPRFAREPRRAAADEAGFVKRGGRLGVLAGETAAQLGELGAGGLGYERPAVAGYEVGNGCQLEQPVE